MSCIRCDNSLHQAHIDQYAEGPSTRTHAETFLYWARKQRVIDSLEVPRRSNGSGISFGSEQRLIEIRRILLAEDDTPLPTRVAAGRVLLHGQPLNRLTRLRLDDLRDDADSLHQRLAEYWTPAPEPFATLLRAHVATRPNQQTATNPDSPWLFPGGMPGQPMHHAYLSDLLAKHGIPALAARSATCREIVHDAPLAVLAQMLGVSPATAMRHAEQAGASYSRYAALWSSDFGA